MLLSEIGRLGGQASAKTTHKLFELREETYNKAPKLCRGCSHPIKYKKRRNNFCSHSCAGKLNNSNRPRIRKSRICASCGNEWVPERLSPRRKYCYNCTPYKPISKRIYEQCKTNRTRRLALIEERGHKCEVCGNSEWLGQPITLELEHINGNSDDQRKENTKLLCPNCHSQTPTYKGKNRGNGRFKRRERYRAGKSF